MLLSTHSLAIVGRVLFSRLWSIWPAVQSFWRVMSTNPGVTACVGAVEEMYVVYVSVTKGA